MQEQESLRAMKVWPHRNVKNEWRGAVVFKPMTGPVAQAVHRTRAFGFSFKGKWG